MRNAERCRRLAASLPGLALVFAMAACGGPGSVVDPDDGMSGPGGAATLRVEADLAPVLPLDASGHARMQDFSGTSQDRFDAEIEIDDSAFAALGIDAADGFLDESMVLDVTRSGASVFTTALAFSEDRRVNGDGDITFEADVRGGAAPELAVGDVVDVRINGTATLQGSLRIQ